MITIVEVGNDNKLKNEFLKLPKRLYAKKVMVQDENAERAILDGTHLLSHYFTTYAYLAMDETGSPISRVMLTVYPDDKTGYMGFFESENDVEACQLVLDKAEEKAVELGCKTIIGPVDASFWIKYRFKADRFESTYTGEPYNKDYYIDLWEKCGYQKYEEYSSNHYKKVEDEYKNEVFEDRLRGKLQEGYVIQSPTAESFQKTLAEVYDLLIVLYKEFPVYKFITKEEFINLYSYLDKIIQYEMIKITYFEGKAVGFLVSIPNYSNLVYGNISPLDLLEIIKIHKNPKDYIMLYMGVDFSHRGLGKALAESIKDELQKKGTPSVGALIRKGNINKDYFANLVDYEYLYYLLKKDL